MANMKKKAEEKLASMNEEMKERKAKMASKKI